MEKIVIWNKLNLHGRKITVLLLLILSFGSVFGQVRKREINLPRYDERLIHYGFTLGLNSSRYSLTHSSFYVKDDTVRSALAPGGTGFSLGFIFNYKFADYFDLRVLPTVSFYERKVSYILAPNRSIDQLTESSTFIELPLMVKYKSERRGNFRFYLIGGIKPAIEAGAKKKEKKETELRTENYDLSVDYGIGLDIYYPLFKFAPEIRFSHGLLNLLTNDPNVYSQSLNKITTHSVSLYLHFE